MEIVRTGTAEHARARSLLIAGIAVMAIGAAMSVWETHAEHALVLQAAQETPSIEGLNVVEISERGWKRGEIVISANGAMLSGKLLKAVMAGGHEEYTRFVDAVRAGGTQSIDERIERASTYIDGLYARRGRNWMEASETAGLMVLLFGVAIIITAVAGKKLSERYAIDHFRTGDGETVSFTERAQLRPHAGAPAQPNSRATARPSSRGLLSARQGLSPTNAAPTKHETAQHENTVRGGAFAHTSTEKGQWPFAHRPASERPRTELRSPATRKERAMKMTESIRRVSAITIAAALGMLTLIPADAASEEVAVMRHTTKPLPGYGTLTLEIWNDGTDVQVIGLDAEGRIVLAREGTMSSEPTFEETGAIEGILPAEQLSFDSDGTLEHERCETPSCARGIATMAESIVRASTMGPVEGAD